MRRPEVRFFLAAPRLHSSAAEHRLCNPGVERSSRSEGSDLNHASLAYSAKHALGKGEAGRSKPPGSTISSARGLIGNRHTLRPQKPCLWEFDSPRAYHHGRLDQLAESNRSKRLPVGVRVPGRLPLRARLAQRQSGGPTNLRSGFRNSHRVPFVVL
jgi:hypothetical protein